MSGRLYLDEIYSKSGQTKVLDTTSFDANNNFEASNTGFNLNYQSANAALNVVQSGTGDALRVNGNSLVVDASGNVGVGTGSPSGNLTVIGSLSNGQIVASQTSSDSAVKYGAYTTLHYNTAEENFNLISGESNATDNSVLIGGGLGEYNAATSISFNTASNNTTTAGTPRMRIDSSGNVGIGTTTAPANLGVNAKVRIQDAFQYGTTNSLGGIQAFAISSPSTKTFTVTGGGNGSKSHLEFKAIAYNGYKQCIFTMNNVSGVWVVTQYVVGSGGTVPTVTVSNSGTSTVTITVTISGTYSGGYLIGTMGVNYISVA